MKTSIKFLGLVALAFTTNTQAANEFKTQDLNQQEVTTATVENVQQQNLLVAVGQEFSKENVENNSNEEAIFNPNSVIKTNYTKSVEEVAAENKLITESKEDKTEPLSIETTLQDRIAENNAIIESTVTNEVYALDFEKINRAVKNNKVPNHNLAVAADLKL